MTKPMRSLLAGAAFVWILAVSHAAAQTSHTTQPAAASTPSEAQKYFTDVVMVNQHNEPMRFYADLLKDRVVVINTFFTSCTSLCPRLSRNMEAIQDWVGDRLGKNVHLISISVDPANDTPPRIKEYARHFHAKPGWYFLTGKKQNVDWALYKLGQFVDTKDDHSGIIIIGNERTGVWKKAVGVAKPEDLIPLVQSVLAEP